ncbi:MAG: hypothetical protein PF689_02260 [Deltaproteobacteria bacterium]|jgi:hypothetical protein|nr:hypothetical protein [Deltaproteobacteria bacterium]
MKRLFLLFIFLQLFFSCEEESFPLYLEYCVPVNMQDSTNLQYPPTVGVVLNYYDYSNAPLVGSEAILNFLLATDFPITVVNDSTLEPNQFFIEEIPLAIVDNLSVGSGERIAARISLDRFPVIKMADVNSILPDSISSVDGVIGGDIFRKFAVKFNYSQDKQCTFYWDEDDKRWPNILFLKEQPATNQDLAEDGYAVIDFSLAGGGNLLLDNQKTEFDSTRVTIQVCVESDPFPLDPNDLAYAPPSKFDRPGSYPISGVNMYGMVSTGINRNLITKSGLTRITEVLNSNNEMYSITTGNIQLAGQTLESEILDGINRIALIGGAGNNRSACEELAVRRGQEWHRLNPDSENTYSNDADEKVPAVTEIDFTRNSLLPQTMKIESIPVESDYWQGLWAETYPSIPQIDFILSHEILKYFEFIIDYPRSRLIMRCTNYNCDDAAQPCCDNNSAVCRCPESSKCCQYSKIKE